MSAEVLLNKGHYDEAIREFQSALRIEPDDGFSQFYLGITLAKKGRWREADDEWHQCLRPDTEYGSEEVRQSLMAEAKRLIATHRLNPLHLE